MTPDRIEILLWCYTRPTALSYSKDIPENEHTISLVKELVGHEMIQAKDKDAAYPEDYEDRDIYFGEIFELTDKGNVFMQALLELPYPVKKEIWTMPDG